MIAPSSTERLGGGRVELSATFLEELRAICPATDVRAEALAEASRDWWPLSFRWALSGLVPSLPGAVARPADVTEVSEVMRLCSRTSVPVTASGGRSGVCGASIPVFGGLSLDCRSLSGIVSVDAEALRIEVRAGTFGPAMEHELQEVHGLTVGHWPQSIELATVGGWVACRGAGQYSTRYGKIEDLTTGLEVVLADGTVVRTGALAGSGPRSATGPDLTQLFVGSEGTLGVITSVGLRARPKPETERRAAFGFSSFAAGLEAIRRTMRRGATPAVVRLYDPTESSRSFDLASVSVLVALDEGDERSVGASMAVLEEECAGAQALDVGVVGAWLSHRNDVSALDSLTRAGIVVDTIEISAAWSALVPIYERATERLAAIDGLIVASAHQSHAYLDGACLYFSFAGRGEDRSDDRWAEEFADRCWRAVIETTLELGGSISHHHGIGLVRAPFLERALGNGFAVLERLKDALDPKGICNPGKLGLASRFGEVGWPEPGSGSSPKVPIRSPR